MQAAGASYHQNAFAVGVGSQEARVAEDTQLWANSKLSVIIRFHRAERLRFLDEALFSLAIQDWDDLETIVVIQNPTAEVNSAVLAAMQSQPWPNPPNYKILSCEIPDGVDGRSSLLNHGINNASGRYLAFLDDDDVVYQHGYTTLINQLSSGDRVIAIGGCRTAMLKFESGHWFVKTKKRPFDWGNSRLDIFKRNFVPIHSYVIDRARLGVFDLSFDDALPPVEDYDFLLRLCAAFEPDFSQRAVPVCEYRLHGGNSIPWDDSVTRLDSSASNIDDIQRSMTIIEERKKEYTCAIPLTELAGVAAMRCDMEKIRNERTRVAYRFAKALERFFEDRAWLRKPVKMSLTLVLKIRNTVGAFRQ